jgi:hypothetical protein
VDSQHDLIDIMKKHISKEIKTANDSVIDNKSKILKYGQMKSLIQTESLRNVIHEVLDDCVKICIDEVSKQQQRIAICNASLELLKDYTYQKNIK